VACPWLEITGEIARSREDCVVRPHRNATEDHGTSVFSTISLYGSRVIMVDLQSTI